MALRASRIAPTLPRRMSNLVAVVAQSRVDGGAEKYLRMLYEDQDDVILFGSIPRWSGRKVPVELGPKWDRRTLLPGLLRLPSEQGSIRAALLDHPPRTSHVQFKREQIGFSRLLSQFGRVVWTEHGVLEGRMRAALGAAYRRAARHADTIICVSQEVAASISELVDDTSKLVVIENPVDTRARRIPTVRERTEARRSLGIRADTPLAVWVGRLDPGKRPLLAQRVGKEWHGTLLLAGDGRLRPQIIDGEGVRSLGYVEPTPLYIAADVLLMTSDGSGEGLPNNVLLEAAAHGVPAVVDGRVPGFARIAQEADGVAVTDDLAWRTALDEVIRGPSRRDAARAWALKHDTANWRRKHQSVLWPG